MTLWLDRVLAVPQMGIQFEPWFLSQHDYMAALKPVLETWHQGGRFGSVVDRGPINLDLTTNDGFTFKISADSIVGSFSYPGEVKGEAGQVPRLITSAAIGRYSDLLSELSREFSSICRHIIGRDGRAASRVGIVTEAAIDPSNPPPGVGALLSHAAAFWNSELESAKFQLLVKLSSGDKYRDRCHHRIEFDAASSSSDMKLVLDWQRVYEDGFMKKLNGRDIEPCVEDLCGVATQYFEKFGEGGINEQG